MAMNKVLKKYTYFFSFLLIFSTLLRVEASCMTDLYRVLKKNKVSNAAKYTSSLKSPDFYLWDNWSLVEADGTIHVYSLAASKSYTPAERHFHAYWRHFVSVDDGKTFADLGPVLKHSDDTFGFDNQAIWSGSVAQLKSGKFLAAYTGLSNENKFLQSLGLAISDDGQNFKRLNQGHAIIDHKTMHKQFLEKGYYVDEIDRLGHPDGELNGSIQALRDPYILESNDGLEIFWAAKSFNENGEVISSIGRATIKDLNSPQNIVLHRPINPPDGIDYSQLELPNVIQREDGKFLWFISTTNRVSELQPETEIEMMARVYLSDTLDSPLKLLADRESSILFRSNDTYTYGLNIVRGTGSKIKGRVFNVEFGPNSKSLSLPSTIPVDL